MTTKHRIDASSISTGHDCITTPKSISPRHTKFAIFPARHCQENSEHASNRQKVGAIMTHQKFRAVSRQRTYKPLGVACAALAMLIVAPAQTAFADSTPSQRFQLLMTSSM